MAVTFFSLPWRQKKNLFGESGLELRTATGRSPFLGGGCATGAAWAASRGAIGYLLRRRALVDLGVGVFLCRLQGLGEGGRRVGGDPHHPTGIFVFPGRVEVFYCNRKKKKIVPAAKLITSTTVKAFEKTRLAT